MLHIINVMMYSNRNFHTSKVENEKNGTIEPDSEEQAQADGEKIQKNTENHKLITRDK